MARSPIILVSSAANYNATKEEITRVSAPLRESIAVLGRVRARWLV